MKKNIFSMGLMAAAALTLTTNCAKTEADFNQAEGTPFELIATSAETKVANDGMATKWSANDQINVFYAEAGFTTYSSAGKFTTATGGSSVTFTGTISGTLHDNNDWYAFYPYDSNLTTPKNTTRYCYVGGNQTQGETATATAHLAGSKFPLYGNAKNVAKGTTPTIEMKQAMSVVKVHVTNNSGAPLTVSSVAFSTEDYNIGGQFYIDFTGDTPVFSEKSGNTYYKSATLTVTGGKTFADGETADFYIGVVPFTAATGKTLKLSVNGYEKSVTLPKNVTFASGKIKTLAFDYDQDPQASTTFVFNTSAGLTELGISEPAKSNGTNLTGPYTKNNVSISFTQSTGGTAPRVWKDAKSVLDLRLYTGNTISFHAPTGYNIVKIEFSSSSSYTADSGTFNGNTWTGSASEIVLTKSSSNHNVNTILVTCSQQQIVPTIANTSVSNADAHGGANLTKDIVLSHYDAAPSLTATPDGTIVTAASVDNVTTSGATVTYTLAPNYSGAAAVGTITVSDGAGHEGTVTVNQVADVFTVSRTSVELYANSGAYSTITVYSDYDWTIDDSSLNGFTVSPNSFTYDGNRSQTVTITATGNNASASPVDLDGFYITRTDDSKNSDVITVSQKSAKLATPTLTITPDSANKKFTVSWTAVTNATKYAYYVEDKDNNEFVTLTETADASTRSFEVSGITLGENYYVYVWAEGNSNPWIDSEMATETVKVNAGSTREELSGTFTYDSNDKTLTLTTTSGITVVQEKGTTGTSAPSNSYNTATTLRVYTGNTLTFSGKTITKIEFTHTSSYKGQSGITANVGTYTQGSTSSSWTGEATSVTITNLKAGTENNTQLRPTKIVVYYK